MFAPLYALRAEDDWGVASFSDLGDLRRWVEGLGGSVTATLPLFAQFLDESMLEPSPYSPASRLFWNETYIDVTRAPGLEASDAAREALDDPALRERIARLRKADLSDHPAVAAAKRTILDPSPSRRSQGRLPPVSRSSRGTRAPRTTRGSVPKSNGAGRGGAPGPTPSGTARFRATRSRTIARYHLYVQWVATQQLAEAADGTGAAGGSGLMLDLPIGVNGAGYDVWRERSSFAPTSPPAAGRVLVAGQDWGAPPPHPHGARGRLPVPRRVFGRCSATPRSRGSTT